MTKNYLLVLPKAAAKSSGGYNVFPVGIAYVSAYLKSKGHRVHTANLEFIEANTSDAMRRLIAENSIDVVCTGGLSRDYPRIKELVDIVRACDPKVTIVVGGGIITGAPKPAMIALGADIGVVGQGEVTMHELASRLDQHQPYGDVPGLIVRKADGFHVSAPRAEVKDLDALPFPDYDGFDYPKYMEQINHEVAYVVASRSCPFKCTFCFHPSGNKYRKRSLDNVFLEVEYLLKRFKVATIVVSDELFAPKRDRVIEFCRRMAAYNISWSVQLRVCDVDEELLDLMKASGCITISYGIESADDRILSSMIKKITRTQIDHALKLTFEKNIDIQGGLIFGDIAETPETAANSLKWYDEHVHYGLELNMIHIFPGTGLYNHACSRGIIKDEVQFLKDGCPLINVSKLTDQEYKSLSSGLYERNMRAKYEPERFEIELLPGRDTCSADIVCNKCGSRFSLQVDPMHVTRTLCGDCKQRYYVDAFKKLRLADDIPVSLRNAPRVALWGAGELCIKMLDNFPVLHEDKFLVVDSSASRQGYSVCGKLIHPPGIIDDYGIADVVVTVVRRKAEILKQLVAFASVANIYVPAVELDTSKNGMFTLVPAQ